MNSYETMETWIVMAVMKIWKYGKNKSRIEEE